MLPYFKKLNFSLANLNELESYCTQDHDWRFNYGFFYIPCPDILIEKIPNLNLIKNKFNGRVHFLRLNSWNLYNFHIDIPRGIVFNAVIKGFDCFTFFSDTIPDLSREAFSPIKEIVYKKKEIYLINTQLPHGVYNRSENRIVLSLGLDKEHSYDKVVEFLKDQNFIS